MPEFFLPIRGVSYGFSPDKAPPLTTHYANNVRAVDVLEKRVRIGQRPGLNKWGDGDQIGAAEQPVVAMAIVSSVV